MGLISRVSSRTYRRVENIDTMLFNNALKHSLMRTQSRQMSAGANRDSVKLWRTLSYTAVPLFVGGAGLFVYRREQVHYGHYHRPEYKEWPWLSIRNKNYPWRDGKKSLFTKTVSPRSLARASTDTST